MKAQTYTKAIAMTALIGASLVASEASAFFAPFDAPEVLLRKDCSPAGVPLNNCFESLSNLNAWIRDTRQPNAARPLHVDIGPGTFDGQFGCVASGVYTGYVTFAGAGTGNTVLRKSGDRVITTQDCLNLVFKDLTISNVDSLGDVPVNPKTTQIKSLYGAAAVNSGGSTTWHSVDVVSAGYGWLDSLGSCPRNIRGEHRWYSSRIVAGGEWAYYGICDSTWFFGSQLEGKLRNRATPNAVGVGAVIATYLSKLFVYGGNVRYVIDDANSPIENLNTVVGVTTGGSQTEVHLHGVGVDVISTKALPVTGLMTRGSGLLHANETAFVLKTLSGQRRTRAEQLGGELLSPYTWQTAATPPNIFSETGYDQIVVTNTSDQRPHLLISDKRCGNINTAGWWDTHTKACW